MAKKFFNQKVKKKGKSKTPIVVIIICALLIIFAVLLILSLKKDKTPENAVIVINEIVVVEINSNYPDKTLFFKELQNVPENEIKINYLKTNLKQAGIYDVEIQLYGKKYKSQLQVIDIDAPVLVLKDLSINEGDIYNVNDFVESCNDNSNNKCIIKYYDLGSDQNGNKIDYSSYNKKGVYEIKIVAIDDSGNMTLPISAKLTIGGSTKPNTTVCQYGDASYDNAKYTVALFVKEDNCAINTSQYNSETSKNLLNTYIEQEQNKLKNEFKKLNLNVRDIYVNAKIDGVPNKSKKGLVGYSIQIELRIETGNGKTEVIESYFLKSDGSRQYLINKYKLK